MDYPALYRDADKASLLAQRKFIAALVANLSLLVATAVLSFINLPASGFAAVQVVLLLGSIAATIYLALGQPQRHWYGTRALAESIKTVTWRYMMKAEPYNANEAAARDHFIANVKKIMDDNLLAISVVRYAGGNQITHAMQETRGLVLTERKTFYDANRVGDQLGWYQKKTNGNTRSARIWFGILVVVEVAAVVAAVGPWCRQIFAFGQPTF